MSSGCGQSIAAAQGTKSKLKASSSQHFRNSTLIIIPCLNQLKKLQTIWQEESHGISKIPQLSQISFQRRAAQVHQHHPRGNTFLGDLQTKGKVENPAQSHTMTPWASQECNHQTTTAWWQPQQSCSWVYKKKHLWYHSLDSSTCYCWEPDINVQLEISSSGEAAPTQSHLFLLRSGETGDCSVEAGTN